MSTMRASLIIEARDKASAVFDKIAAKSRDMGKAFQPVTKEAKQADKAMDAAGRSAWAMSAKMKLAEKAAYGLGKGIGWTARKMLDMAKWGAIGAIAGLGSLAFGIVKIGAKFEQFQAQLEGTEGSAAGAKKALAWVSKFAATTPYELDQVTEAFVRARGVGIDPYTGAMTALGDAASGSGKSIMDAVEALADAQTGEFERLKEFNITSSSKGNNVTFSYLGKDGKSAFKTVAKDAKAIQKTVIDIFNQKYAGGMIRQSRTLVGLWSNIKDAGLGFLYKISQGGIFDKIKNSAAGFLEMLNKAADDGSMERWATEISDGLERAWEWGVAFVRGINWKQTGQDFMAVASAGWTVVKALATAVSWALKLKGALDDAAAAIAFVNGGPVGRANAVSYFAQKEQQKRNETMKPVAMPGRADGKKYSWDAKMPAGAKSIPKIGGVLDINIKADRGLNATPSGMKSANNNVPIRASVGKVQPA